MPKKLSLGHYPPLYTAVLLDSSVHTIAYVLLIAISLMFWSAVVDESRIGNGMAAVPMLFVTLVHTAILGALLVFSQRVWFPVLAQGAGLWGFSPLEDQQLAGLIMWVPMSVVYLAALLAVVAVSFRQWEQVGQDKGV